MTSEENWFSLPPITRFDHSTVTTRVREWVPGDGLTCRNANYDGGNGRKLHCGPPTVSVQRTDSRRRSASSHHVLCALHASSLIRDHVEPVSHNRANLSSEIVDAAQEEVISQHWDEYLAAVSRQQERICGRYLSELPSRLRNMIEVES